MSEAGGKQQADMSREQMQRLKYLDFVLAAAVHAIVFFSTIYDLAKENSGPLKPGVQTVEGTVKTVIGPVYDKFHDVPLELLKFADRKVDDFVHEVDRRLPSFAKKASSQASTAAHKAPELARSMASEVQRQGFFETATDFAKTAYTKLEPTAKDLYVRYEPVAEKYAVSGWRSLNRLPLFPEVAQVLVPTGAYWSEKYNQTVRYGAEREYTLFSYLPLIPTDRIAKVFGGDGKNEEPATRMASMAGAEEDKVTAAE